MNQGVPRWSSVVVAFDGERVLAISRGFNPRDPALPGGDGEAGDTTPASTAAREMFEETGLRARELRLMDTWVGDRGQTVYAFFVPRWTGRIRSSSEGKVYWSSLGNVLRRSATYRKDAKRLLEKMGRLPGQLTRERIGIG
jgi:8-oxo-dGTP pyrophosphatase MutT (NUDIX family)